MLDSSRLSERDGSPFCNNCYGKVYVFQLPMQSVTNKNRSCMGRKEVVMHYLAKQEGELWARPYLFELLPVVTDRTLAAVLCIHSSLIFFLLLDVLSLRPINHDPTHV